MALQRTALVVLMVVALTGCLGGTAILSSSPAVSVENRANASYAVTATVIHTNAPVEDVRLTLMNESGQTATVPFREHGVGNDFDVPANVTALQVTRLPTTTWRVVLGPDETASTELSAWATNDIVLLTWTNLDTGTVTRASTIPCRTAGVDYDAHVETARGSGGASTRC